VHDIVWLLRLPRLILAVLTGAGLSVCGVAMQAIVKNPLADPYILGISSGASLGATAAILLGIGSFLGSDFVGIAAFAGAVAVSFAVLFISNLGGDPVR
jgi:iron complex transport system permease protein